jgi:hypothetical protein
MSKQRFTSEWLRERGLVIVDGVAVHQKETDKNDHSMVGANLPQPLNEPVKQPEKPRKPTQPQRLNRIETLFFQILRDRHPDDKIQPQFRVRITPHDAPQLVHYTADFAVWKRQQNLWTVTLWEVKHSSRPYHSDELVRPKMACLENPWIAEIRLATYNRQTGFTEKPLATNP